MQSDNQAFNLNTHAPVSSVHAKSRRWVPVKIAAAGLQHWCCTEHGTFSFASFWAALANNISR